MLEILCENCGNEVRVVPYFYDRRIITHEENALNNATYYEAIVTGEAVCPMCGYKIKKHFKKTISNKNIVDLAVGD